MAKITCSEFRRLPSDANGNVVPVLGKPLVVQTGLTAPSTSSAQTAAPNNDTTILRLCADVALHVSYNPTATTNDAYYAAGAEIIRAIGKGQRLSYIQG